MRIKLDCQFTIYCCIAFLFNIIAAQSQSKINDIKPKIKAMVNDRSLNKEKKWTVYFDTEMEKKIGQVSAGDTVFITGWSSLLFRITKGTVRGFISSMAVNATKQIDSLVALTELQFKEEPPTALAQLFKDSVKAKVVLTTTKKEVLAGECFVLDLSFYLSDSNKVILKFVDLADQLRSIQTQLEQPDCWISKIDPSNIDASRNGNQSIFPLWKATYCPTSEGLISFPSLELSLLMFKGERFKQKVFKSLPLQVKVLPVRHTNRSSMSNKYHLFGKFTMEEAFFYHHPTWNGNLFYSFEIKGEGLTYPLLPPPLSTEIAEFNFVGSTFSDTLISDVYSSKKKFIYKVIVKKEGTINLTGAISYTCLDPTKMQFNTIASQSSKRVVPSHHSEPLLSKAKNLILIDVSKSMQIEDYKPNRMIATIEGVKRFLESRSECDTQVAVFGGEAMLIDVSKGRTCYSAEKLDSLSFVSNLKRGSSIANAIMIGNMMKNTGKSLEKVIIIGDGDDHTRFSNDAPLETIKLMNIKIYSIGVGSKAPAPYLKDDSGKPYMFENTFDDSVFKKAATLTGGKYFWAKDAGEITKALEQILK